jgi:BTB/POZ domain
MSLNNTLLLNVGGVPYITTRGTLIAAGGSLAAIATTELAHTTDEAGRLFIDRNGQLFQYVLEYVRNNQLTLPSAFDQLDALLWEAEFFCLAGLISDCKTAIAQRDGHLMPDLRSGVPLLRCFKHIITVHDHMERDVSAELSDGLAAFARREHDANGQYYDLEVRLQSSIAVVPAEAGDGYFYAVICATEAILRHAAGGDPEAPWTTTIGVVHGDLDYYNDARTLTTSTLRDPELQWRKVVVPDGQTMHDALAHLLYLHCNGCKASEFDKKYYEYTWSITPVHDVAVAGSSINESYIGGTTHRMHVADDVSSTIAEHSIKQHWIEAALSFVTYAPTHPRQ